MSDQIGEILKQLLTERGFKTRVDYNRLKSNWEQIVGGLFAQHLQPVHFKNCRLVLRASDPGWSQQGEMMKEVVIKSINNHFGYEMVKKIRIVN